jgi:hypothetical protein
MPSGGYTVVYDGKRSDLLLGRLERDEIDDLSDEATLEYHDRFRSAREALHRYCARERDEWATLATQWRKTAEYQLARQQQRPASEMSQRVRRWQERTGT